MQIRSGLTHVSKRISQSKNVNIGFIGGSITQAENGWRSRTMRWFRQSYTAKGILPPVMYIDHLMKHIQRPYYVGLLNAAAFYGAAHQQPQVFSVIIQFPTLRDNTKKCSFTVCDAT